MRVASFDIFETVLVRRVGDPEALFLCLGQRLQARHYLRSLHATGRRPISPEAFAHARHEAHRRAHGIGCHHGRERVDLG